MTCYEYMLGTGPSTCPVPYITTESIFFALNPLIIIFFLKEQVHRSLSKQCLTKCTYFAYLLCRSVSSQGLGKNNAFYLLDKTRKESFARLCVMEPQIHCATFIVHLMIFT